jgi:hypothetical protein
MKKYFVLAVSFVFTITACKEQRKTTINSFEWLTESWAMKERDGMITEDWKKVNDTLLEGRSDFVKGDSIIPFEKVKLVLRQENFYYIARAAGQNDEMPVEFKITSFSDSDFVAENPRHDFPKRIAYKLVNKDSIHAYVDGGPAMADKRQDFYYSRYKK